MNQEMKTSRSNKTNNAMHLGFEFLADELNDAGFDMRMILKPEVDIPPTKELVKEMMFKPIAKAMYSVDSTRDMTSEQISKVWDVMMRHVGEKFGVFVEFPSEDVVSLHRDKNVIR